jgi:hypothetical protein
LPSAYQSAQFREHPREVQRPDVRFVDHLADFQGRLADAIIQQ